MDRTLSCKLRIAVCHCFVNGPDQEDNSNRLQGMEEVQLPAPGPALRSDGACRRPRYRVNWNIYFSVGFTPMPHELYVSNQHTHVPRTAQEDSSSGARRPDVKKWLLLTSLIRSALVRS